MRVTSNGASVVALAALLAGGLTVLAPTSPASADTWVDYHLTERPAGLPATDVPARLLASGTLAFVRNRDGSAVSATLELQDEPTASDDALVVVGLGEPDDAGVCTPVVQRSTTTYDPGTSTGGGTRGSRDGTTLDLAWRLTSEEVAAVDSAGCALARLVEPADEVTLDELDGEYDGSVIADPLYAADLGTMTGRRVRPHRWSTVKVRVTSRSDVRGFGIFGASRSVQVRPYSTDRRLPEGRSTTVRLRVRLKADGPRRLRLSLGTYGSAFEADGRTYRLVPRHSRH